MRRVLLAFAVVASTTIGFGSQASLAAVHCFSFDHVHHGHTSICYSGGKVISIVHQGGSWTF